MTEVPKDVAEMIAAATLAPPPRPDDLNDLEGWEPIFKWQETSSKRAEELVVQVLQTTGDVQKAFTALFQKDVVIALQDDYFLNRLFNRIRVLREAVEQLSPIQRIDLILHMLELGFGEGDGSDCIGNNEGYVLEMLWFGAPWESDDGISSTLAQLLMFLTECFVYPGEKVDVPNGPGPDDLFRGVRLLRQIIAPK